MDILVGFAVFLAAVAACMALGHSLAWALLAGLFCLILAGRRRGFPLRDLLSMAVKGNTASLLVLRILLAIGLLTALWRASGTISFFVDLGVRLITPHSFILIAFLLPAALSLAFGSSFGVSGTAGVILMTIARSGGADLAVTAGAVLSGAYVGERLSPASSAAALTAAVAGVDQRALQRRLWRATPLPLALTVLFYGAASLVRPIQSVDASVLSALARESQLTWPTVLPALILVVLPWCKVSALGSIAASCLTSAAVACFVQQISPARLLRVCVLGYLPSQPELRAILSGGGLVSMVSVVLIVFLSCAYSGLFTGTGMLDPYQKKAGQLAKRIGRFPAQVLLGLCCTAAFCNQSVAIVMVVEMLRPQYQSQGLPPMALAEDLGNSVIDLAGIVPWAIACSVPLANIGSGPAAIPFAVYLYLLPLCVWLTGRWREHRP